MRAFDLSDTITAENVKYIGEVMALVALKAFRTHTEGAMFGRLYKGLVKDMNRPTEAGYAFSDGYDFAQAAICFLCEHYGKTLNDEIGTDRRGKVLTLKRACLRYVSREISRYLSYNFRAICFDDFHKQTSYEKSSV